MSKTWLNTRARRLPSEMELAIFRIVQADNFK